MAQDPDAFKQIQEEQARAAIGSGSRNLLSALKEETKEPGRVSAQGALDDDVRSQQQLDGAVKQKREAIDKQQAFIEFKASDEGQAFENRIRERRDTIKERRSQIKNVTDTLNENKAAIDALKTRLDRKEEERKIRLRNEQLRADDMFEEQAEEIIDEEELVMLRKMKDLKKIYRDNFTILKNCKVDYAEGQRQIDTIKEQLISAFEEWYATEFDYPQAGYDNAYN